MWFLAVAMSLAGLVPAVLFLVLHRPARPFRMQAVNASGWVWIIAFLYARSVLVLVLRGHAPATEGAVDTLVVYGAGVGIDVLLWYRLVSFLRYRRALAATSRH
jgi:hypothetical protein